MKNVIPVTYGYARVSKTDDSTRNLEDPAPHPPGVRDPGGTRLLRRDDRQLHVPPLLERADDQGAAQRHRRNRLAGPVQPEFDEGVRIQAELTKLNIGIIAIREGINTADDSAAAKLFRRMMLAQGAYQVESTSERIKAGLDRAKAEGRNPGRPPALTAEQVEECRRMYAETPSIRRVARIMKVSQGTVKRALELDLGPVGREA